MAFAVPDLSTSYPRHGSLGTIRITFKAASVKLRSSFWGSVFAGLQLTFQARKVVAGYTTAKLFFRVFNSAMKANLWFPFTKLFLAQWICYAGNNPVGNQCSDYVQY